MFSLRFLAVLAAMAAAAFTAAVPVAAQQGQRISITTGGTGGVYYPLGGEMANILSKYIPGLQATAQVTGGSIDNLKLLGAGKTEVAFCMVDAAWEATQGQDKFKNAKVNARTLMVLYPNRMQIVTVDGSGIAKLADLKGKRVSTGCARQRRRGDGAARAGSDGHRSQEGHQAGTAGRGRVGECDQGPEDRCVLLGRRRADGGAHGSRRHPGHEDPPARPRRSNRSDEHEVRAART